MEGIVVAAPLETRHYWRYDLNENLTPKYNDDIQIQYVSKCCVNKIDKKYLEKHGLKLFSKKIYSKCKLDFRIYICSIRVT